MAGVAWDEPVNNDTTHIIYVCAHCKQAHSDNDDDAEDDDVWISTYSREFYCKVGVFIVMFAFSA